MANHRYPHRKQYMLGLAAIVLAVIIALKVFDLT